MGRCNFLIFLISKLGSKFDIEYTGWDQIGGDVVLWDITQFDGREAVELILLSLSSHLLNQIPPPPSPPTIHPTTEHPMVFYVEGLNCKRPIPICRLFFKIDLLMDIAALCLTDFIDWRYIHSLVGIFDPACELFPPWTKELYMCET